MSAAHLIDGEEVTEITSRVRLVVFDQIRLGTARRYLVKGIVPRVGLTVVWGPPKSGKSFWTFDLAMRVALGWDYRGRRVQPGPVVYCAFEGQSGLEARVEAFRQRFLAEDHDPVPFYLEPVTLDLVADHAELIAVIDRQLAKPPALVVLDTLNRSLRGSESSDEDMTAYVRAADAIREAFGCAVVIVHHCGIDGTRPRGHTSLTGACDAQIAVRRDGADNIVTAVELAKDGPQGETILSRLEVVEVGQDDDRETITSCVVVAAEGDAIPGAARVTGQPRLALEALRTLMDAEGQPSPGGPRFDGAHRTIPLVRWRQECLPALLPETDKPDSRRTAFVRAFKKLQNLGLIGFWDDLVWLIEPRRTSRT